MRAKKLLALALAGMALTTCLSGCDRTIIEHQFHTNTVTNTETEYIPVDISNLSGFRCLEQFCERYGLTISSQTFRYPLVHDQYEAAKSGYSSLPSQSINDQIAGYFTEGYDIEFVYNFNNGSEIDNWWSACSQCAKLLCDTSQEYVDSLTDDELKDTIIGRVDEVKDTSMNLTFYTLYCLEDGESLIVCTLGWV